MLIQQADVRRGCLSGEVAVITGGGRGIGRETALALGYLGASVAIAEISETGRKAQDDIRANGGTALWVQTDISDPAAWERFRDRVVAEWGKVDVLINNAEAVCPKAILEHSLEDWERVFAVNCRGVFVALKLFLPAMLERHHGVVVFMPSAQGIPYVGAYSASKAAQESLSTSLAQELGPGTGVSVITFGVGMVETPATREYVPILASRYGLTEAGFIAMAAPGGQMAPAELAGTALAGVVLNAADLHGEQVDWPTGLARIGLTAAGTPVAKAAPVLPLHSATTPTHPASEDIRVLAAGVDAVVREIRREYEDLGVFQKQWYKRSIRHRTGLDIEGWEGAAGDAARSLREGGPIAVDPQYLPRLRRLADHLARSEADWRGYATDRSQLEEGLAVLQRRRGAVLALVTALANTPSGVPVGA